MDRPQPASRELAETLRELEFLNRNFGGHRYVRKFLQRHFKTGPTYRVLDLATGGGDFPRAMVDWARWASVDLRIEAVDANPGTVDLARQFSAEYPEIEFREGDALGFESAVPYDLVHCSLSVHHFARGAATRLLHRCRELSRFAVLVTDLERRVLTRLGVFVVNRFFRHSRMTVHDGDCSARRAYSFAEFASMADRAGWRRFGHERFAFCRQALWSVASR